jgi:hypothetical protein
MSEGHEDSSLLLAMLLIGHEIECLKIAIGLSFESSIISAKLLVLLSKGFQLIIN